MRIHRPDLAIYSQTEEASFGWDPTWNNPNIVTNDWGPFHLMEAVEARIANYGGVVGRAVGAIVGVIAGVAVAAAIGCAATTQSNPYCYCEIDDELPWVPTAAAPRSIELPTTTRAAARGRGPLRAV